MSKDLRVLVANRGEIAVRVIKACHALGIEAVAAVSEADKDSLPAKMADRVVCIGPAQAAGSYLNLGAIVAAAVGTGSNAIHPGYGFLAEQPELADACVKYGLKFIGPQAETMRLMGNKLLARQMVSGYGIPVLPGSKRLTSLQEALALAEEMGFPVLIKAAAGGGGRGMRIVESPEKLKEALETASLEARTAFGDETLYMERYIPNARHIEVQVLADSFGNVVHIGERDCSIQRRYQKVIEEAPSVIISSELREKIHQAAVVIAKSAGYENAGTVEFILDRDSSQFYFLEVNARIQVEHPVSEMISGLDLVQEQLKIAAGNSLGLSQSDIRLTGHAIECRITAEAVKRGFQPCPGRITRWDVSSGPNVRVDSHCYAGYFIPPYYDSLLAKIIVAGANRAEAITRMQDALNSCNISGVETTIPFLQFIIRHPDYTEGQYNTKWVERILREGWEGEGGAS